jgi:FAD/FMN-containing dehydrogenase
VPTPPELDGPGAPSHKPRQLCTAVAAGGGWRCSNWAGSVTWAPTSLVVPASEQELSRFLHDAAAAAATPAAPPRRPLKVVGHAHSWAGLYVPAEAAGGGTGDTLALHSLAGITRLSNSTVEVLAGTSFAQLFAELDRIGLALALSPGGIQGLTVGGAAAVGFHGSQLSLGGVSSVVSALRVLDTEGVAHDLSDATHPEAMRAVRMGLGVCGIVTRVTLPVVPQFHLRRRRWRVDDTDAFLTKQLPGLKAAYDRFHW